MTNSSGSVAQARLQGNTRQVACPAPEVRRQQHVIKLVMLAAAARLAVDRRTVQGAIVVVIGVIAASRLAKERGTPGLDWYLKRAVQKVSDKVSDD
jgi:uncharacterized protein involved in response to NO